MMQCTLVQCRVCIIALKYCTFCFSGNPTVGRKIFDEIFMRFVTEVFYLGQSSLVSSPNVRMLSPLISVKFIFLSLQMSFVLSSPVLSSLVQRGLPK